MAWKCAEFNGKKVWVEVDDLGHQLKNQGRSPIRYSSSAGTKRYLATASRVSITDGALSEDLPDPTDVPQQKKRKGSGFGSAKNRTADQARRAKESAQNLVGSFSSDAVVCFTDGSCLGNPGPAGLGVVMKVSDTDEQTQSVYLGQGTNNVAELSAIEVALEMVRDANIPDERPVEILTDSKYSHGILTLNWKAKVNQELVKRIRQAIENRGNVRIHWVAGHAGIPQNEQADALANQAISDQS